ncbi:MAG: phosphoenolpyruvate--protein phosphotransferase [Thiohalomonadales bacterium]
MLDTLRRIVQAVNDAKDLPHALRVIVSRVKDATAVDLCSVYLSDHSREQNVLMATDGLNPEAVENVRLDFGQGIIGVVTKKGEVINIADAANHERYYYIPQTGEEIFHAYLAVPIIHHRKILGILVVQRIEKQIFDEATVTFLITVAAQLAGAIAHAEVSGGIENHLHDSVRTSVPFQGQAGATGVGIGVAFVMYPSADLDAIPDRKVDNVSDEVEIFLRAIKLVQRDIKEMLEHVAGTLPAEDMALFDAYSLMLESDTLINGVTDRIKAGNWASGALRETIHEHLKVFDNMEDVYLRERSADVRDLGRRILVRLQAGGRSRFRKYPDRTILVGEEITAAMLAEIPPTNVVGVISVSGSRSSHVAILSRAMGIPAVMGADIPVGRIDGMEIIVDGYRGKIFIEPTRAVQEEFRRLADEERELSHDLASLKSLPPITPDGVKVPLQINSGLLADIAPTDATGAEGIGLYRTEFPFMIRDRFPGEQEQFQIYRQVLKSYINGPVTLRTLDVGGDKALPYFPIKEDNPFLGWRGIRITLDHPEIFIVQLRAMLRANVGINNMHVLLPMVNAVSEVDDSLKLLNQAFAELSKTIPEIKMPKIGVMIEVPSAVFQIRELAKRVDFLSVGTNDLIQYLLAVDRNNSRVAELYDCLHPAVLRALIAVVKGAKAEGKPVCICGEMAGDPLAVILLMGMEYDYLSMSVANIPRIKWVIRNIAMSKAKKILNHVMQFEHASEIRDYLNKVLEDAGLGGLVRAGR